MTETEATKQCPYCAETIKAAAVVCRFCGRDLVEQPTPATPAPNQWTDKKLLDWYTQEYARQGWQVVSQTDAAVQLKKPKQWSTIGVVLFVFLPAIGGLFWWPLFGVALIGLVLVLADYLIKHDELVYLTAPEARKRAEQEWSKHGVQAIGG